MSNIEPISQEFYDDNRKIYDAASHSFDLKQLENKCDHRFERKSYTTIQCTRCSFGLIDGNRFILSEGKIIGVK